MRVQARAHRRAANRQIVAVHPAPWQCARTSRSSRLTQPENSWPTVSGVASCKCVRPILTMPANSLRFGVQGVAQLSSPRAARCLRRLRGRGNVHGRGKRVVRRLRHVDVVIRMNGFLAAHRAAGNLDGAIGDHLVDVHVGLRAAAGLPDAQREMIVELAGDHFVGGLHDEPWLCRRRVCRGPD